MCRAPRLSGVRWQTRSIACLKEQSFVNCRQAGSAHDTREGSWILVSSVQHKTSDLPKCNLKKLLPNWHEFRTFRCIAQLIVTYGDVPNCSRQCMQKWNMEHSNWPPCATVYGTILPLLATKVHGWMDIKLHSFLNFTLDCGQQSARRPGLLTAVTTSGPAPFWTLLRRQKYLAVAGKQTKVPHDLCKRINQSRGGMTCSGVL